VTAYNVKLTPLTPVHIGTGEELFPYEYRFLGKKQKGKVVGYCRHYSVSGVLQSLDRRSKQEFALAVEDMAKLRKFMFEHTKELDPEHILLELRVSDVALEHYKDRWSKAWNALELRPFIRPPHGDAYIPGSSLKGALRGAWVTARIKERGNGVKYEYEKRGKRPPAPEPRGIDQEIELRALGIRDRRELMTRDPFKAVKVGDTTGRLQTQISLALSVQWKERSMQDPGMVQTLTEMTSGTLDGSDETEVHSRVLIDKVGQRHWNLSVDVSAAELIEAANSLSEAILEEDRKFFSHDKVRCGDALSVTEQIHGFLEECRSAGNACILRLGWGSGFNSTSLNILSDTPLEIKTRKLADGKWPMGWVRLDWEENP